MTKKIFILLFLVLCSFCVSCSQSEKLAELEDLRKEYLWYDSLSNVRSEVNKDIFKEMSNEAFIEYQKKKEDLERENFYGLLNF